MSAAPLPDSWDDKAFAEAHRRLRENPSALTDADLGMFVVADSAAFAERAAKARAAGVPPPEADAALSDQDGAKPASMRFVSAMVVAAASGFRTLRVSKRLLALEEKVRALEAASLPTYAGVYEAGKSYRQGSMVSRSGGLWLAVEPTDRTPGAGLSGWKLIVKSGAA